MHFCCSSTLVDRWAVISRVFWAWNSTACDSSLDLIFSSVRKSKPCKHELCFKHEQRLFSSEQVPRATDQYQKNLPHQYLYYFSHRHSWLEFHPIPMSQWDQNKRKTSYITPPQARVSMWQSNWNIIVSSSSNLDTF
jgi:hypothetical protein